MGVDGGDVKAYGGALAGHRRRRDVQVQQIP
jgi:hypothetical protein